jgi:hypothetical protein
MNETIINIVNINFKNKKNLSCAIVGEIFLYLCIYYFLQDFLHPIISINNNTIADAHTTS